MLWSALRSSQHPTALSSAQSLFRGHWIGFLKEKNKCCYEMLFAKTKQRISQAMFDLKAHSMNFRPSNVNNPFCAQSQFAKSSAKIENLLAVPQNNWQHWKIMLAFVFAKKRNESWKNNFFEKLNKIKAKYTLFRSLLCTISFLSTFRRYNNIIYKTAIKPRV